MHIQLEINAKCAINGTLTTLNRVEMNVEVSRVGLRCFNEAGQLECIEYVKGLNFNKIFNGIDLYYPPNQHHEEETACHITAVESGSFDLHFSGDIPEEFQGSF